MSSHVTVSSLSFRARIQDDKRVRTRGPEVRLQKKRNQSENCLPSSLDLTWLECCCFCPSTTNSDFVLLLLLLFLCFILCFFLCFFLCLILCLTLPSSAAFLFPFVLFYVLAGNFGNHENISILSPFHFLLGSSSKHLYIDSLYKNRNPEDTGFCSQPPKLWLKCPVQEYFPT